MNKLSFHSLGSESTETVQLLVIVLCLMLPLDLLKTITGQTNIISSNVLIFIRLVEVLISFIFMIVFWGKVKESVGDMTLGKQIKYFIYCSIFCLAFILLGFKLEFFLYIGIIVSIVGFVFYCLIISRCIKEGDEQVKKFGKSLLWGPVSAVIWGLLVYLLVNMDSSNDIGVDLFLLFLGEIVVALLCIYPYYYFYKICKTLNTNKEELWGKQTFIESTWWWIIPLCVLGAILLMSQIG